MHYLWELREGREPGPLPPAPQTSSTHASRKKELDAISRRNDDLFSQL